MSNLIRYIQFDQQYHWEELINIFDTIIKGIINWRYHLRVPTLVGCSQVCLWCSQISGFTDHQFLWKKSIDAFLWPLSFHLSFLFISLELLSNLAGVNTDFIHILNTLLLSDDVRWISGWILYLFLNFEYKF